MYIGIDLGGTKIEGILISKIGEELRRERIATPANQYDAILAAIVGLVRSIERYRVGGNPAAECSVGIAMPGSLSHIDGAMKNCNSTCLNGRFFQQDIEQQLGRTIRIANDANCFALSEAIDGAGKDKPVVFGVILGTGVGGGIVINHQSLVGPNAIGSEWGHNCLPEIGLELANENERRLCYCGQYNCIETYLSGPGFSTTYLNVSGQQKTAKQIAAAAMQNEAHACAALDIYQKQLAYALSQVVNILDPDVVVLGGGMSNVESLYQAVPQLWTSTIFTDAVETPLLRAKFGDSSGVRGAAWLWK